jgi:hypothetical protein
VREQGEKEREDMQDVGADDWDDQEEDLEGLAMQDVDGEVKEGEGDSVVCSEYGRGRRVKRNSKKKVLFWPR